MGPFCLDCRICGGVWACDTSPGSHTWLGFLLIVEPPLCPVPSPHVPYSSILSPLHSPPSLSSLYLSLSIYLSVCLSLLFTFSFEAWIPLKKKASPLIWATASKWLVHLSGASRARLKWENGGWRKEKLKKEEVRRHWPEIHILNIELFKATSYVPYLYIKH